MTSISNLISAGFREAYWCVLDANGYVVGSTLTAPAAGDLTGAGMSRLYGVKVLPSLAQEPESVAVTGDNGLMGTFIFNPVSPNEGILQLATQDTTFLNIVQGTLNQTLADGVMSLVEPVNPVRPNIGWLFIQDAQSQDTATQGAAGFNNIYFMRTTVAYLGMEQLQERAETVQRFKIVASRSTRLPNGVLMSNANNGDVGALGVQGGSTNRQIVWRWTGNGVVTSFTLPTAFPIATAGNGSFISSSVNGTAQVYTTDFTTTSTNLTFVSPPANNAVITSMIAW